MNILVTGGAGFIGSHLCDALLKEEKNKIWVIDDLSLGRIENITHLKSNSNFNFFQFNLLDKKSLNDFFESVAIDVVFHLAANSDIARSYDNPTIDLNNTFMTTFEVLNQMRVHGVKKFVMASTSAIYGDTQEELVENLGPLMPVSHYGAGKLASEAFISSFSENYGIKSWIIRFPNVVGERTTHGVIYDFINKVRRNSEYLEVLGDGKQNKPYLYVKDLIDAILFIYKNSNNSINVYNVGPDTKTSVSKIAELLLDIFDIKREIKYTGGARGWIGDVPFFNYNTEKLKALGWKSEVSSDDAVKKAILAIKKHAVV